MRAFVSENLWKSAYRPVYRRQVRLAWFLAFTSGCSFSASTNVPRDGDAIDAAIDAQKIDGAPGTARRKRITVPDTKVFEDVTAFPVYFVITDSTFGQKATTAGDDIYFTKPDGTALEWERMAWDKATGHLEAWVRMDLANNTPTDFDLRYGDPGPAHAPNPLMTWSNGWQAVWHFEDPLGGNTMVADARGVVNGTAQNGPTSTTGKVGKAIDFDGNNDEVQFTNPITMNNSSTISAWVKIQAPTAGFSSIMTVGNPATGQSRFLHTNYNGLAYGFFLGAGDVQSNLDIHNNQFTLVHFTYDGGTKDSALYRDGTQVGPTVTITSTVNTAASNGHIGNAPQQWGPGGNTTNPINGIVDEVRISNVARTIGWIKTEVANQSDPGAFFTIGPDMPAQ